MNCAFFLALVCSQVQAAGPIAVSSSGTPSYSYPIGIPPGIAGMQPNVGLLYNASPINGPVGYGWSIQGMSMITRCSGNQQIDGYAPTVTFGVNDKLCLDGQRLIQTDANGNVANANAAAVPAIAPSQAHPFQFGDSTGYSTSAFTEFRTETDSYARIRAYGQSGGNAANGPAYFVVWTKSGQIYEYGINSNSTSNAQINVEGSGVITAWPVSRISDTLGNYIDFQYTQSDTSWGSVPSVGSAVGHEWNLAEIRYTGNVNLGQLPTNKIVFTYGKRTNVTGAAQDIGEAYHMGSKTVGIQRLASVTTYINWPSNQPTQPASAVAAKLIQLGYTNGTYSNRSLLQTITECNGALTACMPPTTFNYSSGGGWYYTTLAAFQNLPLASLSMQDTASTYVAGASSTGVLTGDFFGSGRLDIIRWSDNPTGNVMYQNLGGGVFSPVPQVAPSSTFALNAVNFFRSDGCFSSIAADFNGDGLTDILQMSNPSCPGGGASTLYLSTGNGSFTAMPLPSNIVLSQTAQTPTTITTLVKTAQTLTPLISNGPPRSVTTYSKGSNFYILDVDGDGLLDIVTTIAPSYTLSIGTPAPTIAAMCGIGSANYPCTHVYRGQPNGTFVEVATNLSNQSVYAPPFYTSGNNYLLRPYVSDVNGDGLSDLSVNSGTWISQGNGSFANIGNSNAGGCQYPLDFNGDGRADCISALGTVANQSLNIGVGTTSNPVATNFNLTLPGDELFGLTTTSKQNVGIQLADMDGDGRTDIIRWKDDYTQNTIFLSNGDGTFRVTNDSGLTNYQLQKSDGSVAFSTGDFMGNGNTEILIQKDGVSNNLLLTRVDPTPPDQLTSVVSGTGLTTTLTWVTLPNSASGALGNRYTSDRGTVNAAVFPVVDATIPIHVVATTTTQTGTALGTVSTEYAYNGAKYAVDGRGWLGFRNTLTQDLAPNGSPLTKSTQYLMVPPYIGMPFETEVDVGTLSTYSLQVLSKSTTIYCDTTSTTTPSPGMQAPCQAFGSAASLPYRPAPYRPYVYQTTSTGTDLNGAVLPTVTTTNTYNGTGDPIQISVSTTGTAAGLTDTFTKLTTNTYLQPNTSGNTWILGRLQSSTVASTVTSDIGNISTAAGNSPWATATWSDGATPVVVSPGAKAAAKWLMPVLSTLLLSN